MFVFLSGFVCGFFSATDAPPFGGLVATFRPPRVFLGPLATPLLRGGVALNNLIQSICVDFPQPNAGGGDEYHHELVGQMIGDALELCQQHGLKRGHAVLACALRQIQDETLLRGQL